MNKIYLLNSLLTTPLKSSEILNIKINGTYKREKIVDFNRTFVKKLSIFKIDEKYKAIEKLNNKKISFNEYGNKLNLNFKNKTATRLKIKIDILSFWYQKIE